MINRHRLLTAVIVALAMVIAACGDGDSTASEDRQGVGSATETTVAENTDQSRVSPLLETAENIRGDQTSPLLNLVTALDRVRNSGGYVAWATVATPATSEGSAAVFAVQTVIQATSDAVATADEVTRDEYFGPALTAGDTVLLVARGDEVVTLAVQDSSGEFVDPGLFIGHSLGMAASEFIDLVNSVPSQCVMEPADPIPSDLAAAVAAYLRGDTPLQVEKAARAKLETIIVEADGIAGSTTESVDPVIGISVPNDAKSIVQQLADDVGRDDVVVDPMLPVYLLTDTLEDRTTLVFVDGLDASLLALHEITPGRSSGYVDGEGMKLPIVEAFVSQPHGDMLVYSIDPHQLSGCITAEGIVDVVNVHGKAVVTVPASATDATHRPLLDIPEGTVEALDSDGFQTLLGL